VVVEKTANDKESLKITIKAPMLGGGEAQAKIVEKTARQPEASQPVRLVHTTGQFGLLGEGGTQHHQSDRFLVPVRRPSSPWTEENLHAKEFREEEMEVRRRRLSV
jgi:hypothetical protein